MNRRSVRQRHPALAPGWLVLAAAVACPVQAQTPPPVRLAEAPATAPQERLEALLASRAFQLWTRDTVLATGDEVRGAVLVLDATARVAGRIEGDVFVVGGDLFLRTGGSVAGDVIVLGGGFYDSDLAEVTGRTTYRPNEGLRGMPEAGGWVIYPVERDLRSWSLDGTRGFRTPVYQRTDALTLGWGGAVRAVRSAWRPGVEGSVRFKTGPGEVEGSLRPWIEPSDRLRLGVLAERRTRSRERWIRRGWLNSIATLVAGDDVRNYYRADAVALEAEWSARPGPEWVERPTWSVGLRFGWESSDSLRARDVFVLLGDDSARPNPAAGPGDLWSGALAFQYRHETAAGHAAFGLGIEAAPGAGDFEFALAEARFSSRIPLARGYVEAFGIGRWDVAGDVPMQRRSALGGAGTLPVLPTGALVGERMGFAEAAYIVPLLGADLGGLELFGRGSAGVVGGGQGTTGVGSTALGSLQAGVRLRALDFNLEAGAAFGNDAVVGGEGRVELFLDLRMSRSHRVSMMADPGRRF